VPQIQGCNTLDEDDVDDSLDHIIMAVDIKERGTVGSHYVAREERDLFAMEDVAKCGSAY